MTCDPKWSPYFHYMREAGATTGSANQNKNGSVTPVELTWKPSDSGYKYAEAYRLIVYIEDNAAMRVQDFGAISGGLTNGVDIEVVQGGVTFDALDDASIRTNGEWAAFCYDASFLDHGAGNNVFKARWTAAPSVGVINGRGQMGGSMPFCLQEDDQIIVRINDDLTSLVDFRIMVQMRAKVR